VNSHPARNDECLYEGEIFKIGAKGCIGVPTVLQHFYRILIRNINRCGL